jgi:hypothetical protein
MWVEHYELVRKDLANLKAGVIPHCLSRMHNANNQLSANFENTTTVVIFYLAKDVPYINSLFLPDNHTTVEHSGVSFLPVRNNNLKMAQNLCNSMPGDIRVLLWHDNNFIPFNDNQHT